MFQNFPDFGFFGNPNLRPESSVGYDLGFEQRLADSVQFGVTYFRNNIKNLIDDNADFTSYANVGRAVTDGVESFASYQPMQALTLRADYTFTQASQTQGQRDSRVAAHRQAVDLAQRAVRRRLDRRQSGFLYPEIDRGRLHHCRCGREL
jgi:outer membrane cobalamin receptor